MSDILKIYKKAIFCLISVYELYHRYAWLLMHGYIPVLESFQRIRAYHDGEKV